MSAPLPNALRTRFQKLIEEELSDWAVALRLKLSTNGNPFEAVFFERVSLLVGMETGSQPLAGPWKSECGLLEWVSDLRKEKGPGHVHRG